VHDELGNRASVLLEAGPRTLRPNSPAVLELVRLSYLLYILRIFADPTPSQAQIHLLGLAPALLTTPLTSPAARNRFLYLPPPTDASAKGPALPSGLVQLPASLPALFSSPLGRRLLLPALLHDLRTPPNRPLSPTLQARLALMDTQTAEHTAAGAQHTFFSSTPGSTSIDDPLLAEDDSFGALCERRFGPEFARTFASALVHGIYAADARTLSVRAAFPALWDAERRGEGSVVRGMLARMLPFADNGSPIVDVGAKGGEYKVGDVAERMKGVSVFSFREGISALTDALVKALEGTPNVRLVREAPVNSVSFSSADSTFSVRSSFLSLYRIH
jgi:oxygen-dependent protoporphyrinogen oxidase